MATHVGAAADAPIVTLGLLSDPGLLAELSAGLAAQLPDPSLEHETDGRARWRVETASQELTLDEHGTLPSVEIGQRAMAEHRWDLVILVTELPRRAGTQPIVSDYGLAAGVGLVSLPGFGAMGAATPRPQGDRAPGRRAPDRQTARRRRPRRRSARSRRSSSSSPPRARRT